MKEKLHKTGIVLFCTLFLCGSLLNYPFYRFALNEVKNEMAKEVDRASLAASPDLVKMVFTASEWKKLAGDENEFSVNGNWYDVVSASRAADGGVTVKCLRDSRESLLNSWLKKVTADNGAPANDNGHKNVKSGFSGDYLLSDVLVPVNVSSAGERIAAANSFPLSNGYLGLPEVPPRIS
ncbi:MAG TPA: hypothetical protein VFU15_03705 [Bacteroidia bacterium]|nr:hypothetical protein [Bacteroidia bacterium]